MKALILALLLIVGSSNAFAAPATCLDPTLLGMSPSASATTNRNALIAALAQSLDVCIPPGTYQINDTINNSFRSNQTLRGAGRNLTKLQATASWLSSTNFFYMESVSDVTISDLTIDGNSGGNIPGVCIVAAGSPRVSLIRIGCINILLNGGVSFQQIPSTTTGSPNGLLVDSYFNNIPNATGAHTVEISLSDSVIVSNNIMDGVDNGVNIAASNYVVVSGNRITNPTTANSGFGGIRCANQSVSVSVTGNTIFGMSRGLFILGCNQSTFTGNALVNSRSQPILIQATTGSATPTRYNTVTGNAVSGGCLGGGCSTAIELNISAGAVAADVIGNVVVGNTIRDFTGALTQGIIASGGVTAGTNTCANNNANVTLGSC